MSQMWGMDIQGVRMMATQLDSKAEEIEAIISTLTATLEGTQWVGQDATRFRSDWSGQHTSQLRTVAQALRTTANQARSDAGQQESASA